ncbi:fiber [Falcon aviadenovirus A]|nr:fiber [Falcon aviadenovirus A]
MKRRRTLDSDDEIQTRAENSIDLVYPKDAKSVVPMPPFVDTTTGLYVNGFRLGIRYANPLSTWNGTLGLRIGDGLKLVNGVLTSTSTIAELTADSPLAISNNTLSLKYTNGLDVSDGNLTLKLKPDGVLSNSSDGLQLNLGNGLQNYQNAVRVKTASASAVTLDENGIGIRYSHGLTVQDNSLQLLVVSPITVSSEGVSLRTGEGLTKNDSNQLVVQVKSPISLSSEGIGLAVGEGITTNERGIALLVEPNTALAVTDAGLKFMPGKALTYDGNAASVKLTSRSGLKVNTDNGLGIHFGMGTQAAESDGSIMVKSVAPIGLDERGVYLKTGNGLSVDSQGRLQAEIPPPMSPVTFAEFGSETLSKAYTTYVSGISLVNRNYVRPFVSLTWTGTMVSGILRLRIKNSDFQDSVSGDIKISFVLDPMQTSSNTSMRIFKQVPNDQTTLNKIRPSNMYINHSLSYSELVSRGFLDTGDLKWYTTSKFGPSKTNVDQAYESDFYLSTLYDEAYANVILYFIVNFKGPTNFFNKNQTRELYAIDIPFSYCGLSST